jgi:hypothetical protein
VSNKQRDQRESVTPSEVDAPELFDFGPDIERPPAGPLAALPPWMADEGEQAAPAEHAQVAQTGDLADEVTPEPVMVPEFARIVPAPRRRRKPPPADDVVIAAPAVVDGSGNAVVGEVGTSGTAAPSPLLPTPRTEDAPKPAEPTVDTPVLIRPRRRWVGLTQAAAIVAVGATVGVYAAGGLGFLENRTKANPPTAEASAWVLNNLAGAGSVLVPSSMTDTLIQNGQDSDALTTYPDGSTAPIDLGKNCCSYVVVIGGPDQAPGTGLPTSVSTLFQRSPDKVAADLAADRKALVATGKSLIASGKVELSPVAKQQLQNGEVDARVLLGIVAVALEHKVTVASFPAQPGETAAGILRRSAAISAIDGKAVKDGSDRVKSVKAVLGSRTGIFRPAGAEVHPVDGVDALEFRFDAPSPFGLLTLTDENGQR